MKVEIPELETVYVASPEDMDLIKSDLESCHIMSNNHRLPVASFSLNKYAIDVRELGNFEDYPGLVSTQLSILIGRAQGAGATILLVEFDTDQPYQGR
ncbi:hypothetical protein ACLD0W_12510 [Alloalcanivorax sp. C16-1]|uniref:hypothetical protein n=1 Tax=Alloalcanivorax sp. C16-1 TaxID=3390051 RepID=UPI0039705E10